MLVGRHEPLWNVECTVAARGWSERKGSCLRAALRRFSEAVTVLTISEAVTVLTISVEDDDIRVGHLERQEAIDNGHY